MRGVASSLYLGGGGGGGEVHMSDNYSTNVQKTFTHEHPSGESADEVKGEGVVFLST